MSGSRNNFNVRGPDLVVRLSGRPLADRLLRVVDEEIVLRGIAAVAASAPAVQGANAEHAAAVLLDHARLQALGNWVDGQCARALRGLEAALESEMDADDPTLGEAEAARLFASAAKRVGNAFSALGQEVLHYLTKAAGAVAHRTRGRLDEHHGAKGGELDAGGLAGAPVLGATVAEHFAKVGADYLFRFKAAVRGGLANGESLEQLKARVFGGPEQFARPVTASGGNDPGHPFWGNQYAELGAKAEALSKSAVSGRQHREAKSAHYAAARAHLDAMGEALKAGDMEKTGFHSKAAGLHMDFAKHHEQMARYDAGVKKVERLYDRGRIDSGKRDEMVAGLQKGLAGTPTKANEPVQAGVGLMDLAEAVKKRLQVEVRLMDGAEGSLDKVIQAALTAFANRATDEVTGDADAEEDEVEMGFQWVAVHDDRTCDACQFYDGSRWDAEYEPVGEAPEYPGDPPVHKNCRCALSPSDLSEPAAEGLGFDDYLAHYSRSEQESAFGKANLRAYHRGDITASQLVGQKTHELSLDDFIGEGGK